MGATDRRILALVSDTGRGEALFRALNPKGFRVSSCLSPTRLHGILRSFSPATIVVDFDPMTWAQHRNELGAALRGRDVLLVSRDGKRGVAKAALLEPRGIVFGLPTWDALSMWLDVPEAADPNRATYSEAYAMR